MTKRIACRHLPCKAGNAKRQAGGAPYLRVVAGCQLETSSAQVETYHGPIPCPYPGTLACKAQAGFLGTAQHCHRVAESLLDPRHHIGPIGCLT